MINKAYFELDEKKLLKNYHSLENALLKYWPNFKIGYSYKTNSLPWLVSWMQKQKALAEVVSTPEYLLAKKIGHRSEDIILNGPNKGFDSLKEVLDSGGIVNLDGFHEIDWIESNLQSRKKNWQVGLRLNIDLESLCPGETIMGHEPGRFGFSFENGDFNKAVNKLNNLIGVDIIGIHVHHSTKTKSLNVFNQLAEKSVSIAKSYITNLKYIDIGGGFFGDKLNSPTYDDYLDTISKCFRKFVSPSEILLIIEPGISLAASCFSYKCTVIDIKCIKEKTLVFTNGSSMHIDPQMKRRKFNYYLKTSEKNIKIKEQVICGYTCIENDRFLNLKDELKLSPGDVLTIENAGAYTLSFIPLFIEYFPRVVLSHNNKVIREEWGINEYMQLSELIK